MASINAATAGGGGVITTSDATGNLNIQSGGSTVVAVTATGVAVTGTLAATGTTNLGNLTFTGTGNRITGDFSNATIANRVLFQSNTTNGNTNLNALPNGTSQQAVVGVFNNSDPTNASASSMLVNATESSFRAGLLGTGTYLPMTFHTGGSERARIDTSGNVGIGVTSTGGNKVAIGGSGLKNQFINTDATNTYLYSDGNAYFGSTAAFNTAFITNNTERMRIDSSGNLLLGTTSTGFSNSWSASLRVASLGDLLINHPNTATSGTTYAQFGYNGAGIGSITQNGTTAVAYNTSSDYRLKENISPMTGALATVSQLKPVTYSWKSDGSDGQGFIAHELQAVVPDCVTGEKDATSEEEYEVTPAVPAVVDAEGVETTPAVEAVKGTRTVPSYQGIDTSFLVATLTAAIQEQQALITQLQADVAALKELSA